MTVPPTITSLIEESDALKRSGDIGGAFLRAREALERAQSQGDAESIASALVCLAHSHYHLGHYDEVRALAEEALNLAGPLTQARADSLRILGDCAHESGDLTAAEAYYRRAVDLGRQLGYHYILHRCLHSLSACVYIPRGQFDLALAADEESLRLALDHDLLQDAWLPLITTGWVYWVTGRRARALAVTEEMRRFVQPGSLAQGYWACLRGDLAQEGEKPESALTLYGRARSIAEEIGDPALNGELRVGLSRYHRRTGNAPTAYEWADDALTIASHAQCRDVEGWALIERGRASWQIGNSQAAESDLRAAVALLNRMGAQYDLARAYLLLAGLLHEQTCAGARVAWLEAVSRIVSGGYGFLLEQERALAFPLLATYVASDDPAIASLSATLLDHLERVPPPPLHVLTLGTFEVAQGTRTIPAQAWRKRRAGELFRLLLVSPGRSLLRDQVADALWPEQAPASSPALFHQATSALRRALEPDLPRRFPSRYVITEGGQVTLHLPKGSRVDGEALERHIQAEAWEAALTLYHGDLFPDDRYADWAALPRERFRQYALQAAVEVARQRLEAEDARGSLDAARRALTLEPWQEEAVLVGMRACLALNDRTGALRLYLELAACLREELDIAPRAELQSLYESLL
jgi:DNA-binding SARP family transcriptional activator/tetratricopeptide (TPR) repeat protein